MADVTNTLGTLTAENKTFYERVLLERLTPELVYAKYGQQKSAPKKEGDTMNFRRFNSITPPASALTEGVTPDGSALTVTAVTATVSQYGDFVRVTDKLDMVGIDPVLTEASQVLGESAGLKIDTTVRDIIKAGTNVQYAGGKTARASVVATDKLTSTEIKKAVRTLKKNNAKPLENGFFIGFISPETSFDLQADSLWQDVSKYNGGENIITGEVGKMCGVKFIETSNAPTVTNGAASAIMLHQTLIAGKDAYGVVDVNGSSKPEIIVKQTGSAGADDPLNQRATVGWKAMMTAVRLNELSMVRVEHAVSE